MATNNTNAAAYYGDAFQSYNRLGRARVGGSGNTVFKWLDQPLAMARQISHQAPTPVGPGTTPIHPMDEPHPVELVTPIAATMGQITLEFYDIFNQKVWDRLSGLTGAVDIVSIFRTVAKQGPGIYMQQVIQAPHFGPGETNPFSGSNKNAARRLGTKAKTNNNSFTITYHNVVISQVIDSETIEVGTMEVLKQIVVNYTHSTRSDSNDSNVKGVGNNGRSAR
jgi:hypothetical protein